MRKMENFFKGGEGRGERQGKGFIFHAIYVAKSFDLVKKMLEPGPFL